MTTRPFVFLIPFLLQLGKHIANQVCFYLLQLCKSNFPLLTGAFTAAQASLQCFTCGLPDIPTDVPTQNKTRQLGNSCEQFLNETGTQESQKFLTQCPPETLSCYNARGSMISGYDEENSLNYHYMGCSEVKDLPFKTGCHKTMHVSKGRPEMVNTYMYQICTFINTFIFQIELSIEICYCFEDKCNHPDSLAMAAAASSASSVSSTFGNFLNLYLLFLRQDFKWLLIRTIGFFFQVLISDVLNN